jgi:hypothetical protein
VDPAGLIKKIVRISARFFVIAAISFFGLIGIDIATRGKAPHHSFLAQEAQADIPYSESSYYGEGAYGNGGDDDGAGDDDDDGTCCCCCCCC